MKYLFLLSIVFCGMAVKAQQCLYIAPKKDSNTSRYAMHVVPLYVINGKIQKTGNTLFIHCNPSDIEAISVLNNKVATEKYGLSGVNGAIIITLIHKK